MRELNIQFDSDPLTLSINYICNLNAKKITEHPYKVPVFPITKRDTP